jgi:glycine/D-amino acid oxidase-like deaminating enzyme
MDQTLDQAFNACCLQATGSMLIATSAEETASLQQRQRMLQAAGVRATHVESGIVGRLEPALSLGLDCSALLVPDDLQISGRRTAAALQRACEAHGQRFRVLFHESAEQLVAGPSGRVEGVQTSARM